jgi:hypothetical protein
MQGYLGEITGQEIVIESSIDPGTDTEFVLLYVGLIAMLTSLLVIVRSVFMVLNLHESCLICHQLNLIPICVACD